MPSLRDFFFTLVIKRPAGKKTLAELTTNLETNGRSIATRCRGLGPQLGTRIALSRS